jgi:peptidoglycan/LPS O-acetylase OafA/YrhL
MPKRHLLKAICSVVVFAPVTRLFFCLLLPDNAIASYATTFCCMDLLGIGGLLALFNFNRSEYAEQKQILIKYGLLIGGPLFLCSILTKEVIQVPEYFSIFYRTAEAFFYVWLIGRASEGMTGLVGRILDLRVLVEIGKVSYGIYLFHPFITGISTRTFKLIGVTLERGVIYFVIHSVLSIVIAYFSWLIIERPINSLKDRFEQKTLTFKAAAPEEG